MSDLDLGATIRGFSPGQKVFNRFTLQRILGRGGMGIVWLARDEDLERNVALKFLPDIVALDRESVTELKRETRRNLELTHPHIVRIYDFVQDSGAAAISMEFIDGASLSAAKVDRPHGVFAVADIARWTAQLCEALAYAHVQAKVVHRDLKPANLMIDARGELKITDFGIACSISDSVSRVSKNMDSSGTPLYMSPQQMMGDRPTASDDIYALGATLYELFTGKPPFHTGNIILQVQNKVPPPLSVRRAELLGEGVGEPIPPEWEAAIAACLAKDPAGRPASIAAVAAQLGLAGSFPAPDAAGSGPRPMLLSTPANPPPLPGGATASTAGAAPAGSTVPPPAATAPQVVVPRRPRGPVFWIGLAAGIAVLAAAGIYFGDVPKRIEAAQHIRTAQTALFASDWPAALGALRRATALRPTDIEYRREYDEAQRRWIAMVEGEIATLEPRAVYDQLIARSPAAVALVEPYSETFRRLVDRATQAVRDIVQTGLAEAEELSANQSFEEAFVTLDNVRAHAHLEPRFTAVERAIEAACLGAGIDYADTASGDREFADAYAVLDAVQRFAAHAPGRFEDMRRQVREREVNHELEVALAAAREQRFAEALAQLDLTRQRGLLPEAVEHVAGQVRQLAESYSIDRLARALVAAAVGDADQAIADYARFTGYTFTTTGKDLVDTRELDAFLAVLEDLRMRPPAGQPRTHWRDVALVTAVRARFADAEAVKTFLRQGYTAWSRQLAEENQPGLALYLDAQARREGAAVDEAWEKPLRTALAGDVDLRLAWLPTKLDGRPGDRLNTDPVRAFRAALEQRLGSMLTFVTQDGPATIALATTLSGPTQADQPQRERRTSRYQSGTRQVTNYEYGNLQSELRDAERALANAEQRKRNVEAEAQRSAQNSGNLNSSGALGLALVGGVSVGIAQAQINSAYNEVQRVRNQLYNTPRTLTEAVYSDEPYDVITHNMTYRARLIAQPERGDGSNAVWESTLSHRTVEVTGNASRGVPVQAPTYPAPAAIDAQLAQALADGVRDLDRLMRPLATASFRELARRAADQQASLAEHADDQWGLVLLWRGVQVEPPAVADVERRVREALGLPRG